MVPADRPEVGRRALRAAGLDVPALVLTAVPQKAAGLGAAVVPKPFDLEDLCAAVARALAG